MQKDKKIFSIQRNKYNTKIYFFGVCIYNSLKKMLFINPEDTCYGLSNPIAILDLASYLRKKGLNIDVCGFPKLPEDKKYDAIGISCVASYGEDIFRQMEIIRQKYPKAKIVMGGKWSTTISDEDKIKLKALKIEIETARGELVYTGDTEIDFQNYPSWDKNDLDILYKRDQLMTSRGCPFHCHFCNNTENKISYFSANRTADNIELLLKKRENVFFVDDVFVTNFEHAKSIYDECKRRNIKIEGKNHFFVHLKTVNDKTIELIKLFQPSHIEVGIESGDNRILKLMNKTNTVEEIRQKIPVLAKYTKIRGLWIVGYPYENIESLDNSYNLMKELNQYFEYNWVSCYIPLIGTVGHKMALAEGGDFMSVTDNQNISYVPKSLTKEILLEYRNKMFNLKEATQC